MAGGNFLGRVISYVVNELVVEGLANKWRLCPAFQRFAVRTSKTLQDLSTKAAQAKEELAEQLKEATRNADTFKRQ